MIRPTFFAVVIFVVGLLTTFVTTPSALAEHSSAPIAQDVVDDDALVVQATSFIEQLANGEYATATEQFNSEMLEAVSSERLEAIWKDIIARHGSYTGIVETQVETDEQYTRVILTCAFEQDQLNLRLTFTNEQQIAGFFQSPVQAVDAISNSYLIALVVAAIFAILYPVVLAFVAQRQLHVGWRFFAYGALIFIAFQLVSRLPLVVAAQALIGPQLQESTVLAIGWLAILALTAGLFEEVGRYVGYRWLMKRTTKTWNIAVMYGIGHGGIEAILLVGIGNLITAVGLASIPATVGALPADQQELLAQQLAPIYASPDWVPLLGAWERLWAIIFHVALSVMVFQVFRRNDIRWLWLAIAIHALANFVVVGVATFFQLTGLSLYLVPQALMLVLGIASLWFIWRCRESGEQSDDTSASHAGSTLTQA
ncbi:MAG: YhfC family glutamic-type intramembrane protease [Chloroflexota bacterium]